DIQGCPFSPVLGLVFGASRLGGQGRVPTNGGDRHLLPATTTAGLPPGHVFGCVELLLTRRADEVHDAPPESSAEKRKIGADPKAKPSRRTNTTAQLDLPPRAPSSLISSLRSLHSTRGRRACNPPLPAFGADHPTRNENRPGISPRPAW